MKTRVTNLNYEGVVIASAEIHLINCLVDENNKGTTFHKVSSIRVIEGKEVITELKGYNHSFDYKGGNVFNEALQSLSEYLADPTT